MAFGYPSDAKLECAVYATGPMMGRWCGDPERIYGDLARETDDLVWFEGTEEELLATANDLDKGSGWKLACGIRQYLA